MISTHRRYEDVRRLDITVHDAPFVTVGESLGDRGTDEADVALRERARIHRDAQVGALDEFEYEYRGTAFVGDRVVQRDEARVIQRGKHAHFAVVATHVVIVGQFRPEDLERDATGKRGIGGLVDARHAPAANEALDAVPLGDESTDARVTRIRRLRARSAVRRGLHGVQRTGAL